MTTYTNGTHGLSCAGRHDGCPNGSMGRHPLKMKALLPLALARIHRRRASGQCPEAARGCSCESGIMVLKQQSRPQNKEHPIDAHATIPTASVSPSTTTAWWPMLGCSSR